MTTSITDIPLNTIAEEHYIKYSLAVNEDRSVPGGIDGLKPVARRVLWAAFKMGIFHNSKVVKSARLVGETLGKFHPHGDTACYDAIVTMVNSPMPLMDGIGNWGNFSDSKAAAFRYTNCKLSKYADTTFFNKFYIPTISLIENYDGSEEEPLNLPALLPNILLNGTFGIGVGISTSIPSYSLDSVIKVLKKAFAGEKIDYKICAKYLEFTSKYGGEATIEEKETLKSFYKTGKASIKFKSIYTIDAKKGALIYTKFAPFKLESALEKCSLVKGVIKPNDISDKKDVYGKVQVTFRKLLKDAEKKAMISSVEKIFSSQENFDIKITNRNLDNNGGVSAKLAPSTVPEIINQWAKYRIELEKNACHYWMTKYQVDIDKLNLMRLAVANKDFLIKALNKKCTEEELAIFIAKQLKITVEQANQLLDLKVRQLRSLEDEKLLASIKELETKKKELKGRHDKPAAYIITHLDTLLKELSSSVK